MGEPHPIREHRVKELAPGCQLAARLTVLPSVGSTMDEAKARLEGLDPPFVLQAESQSTGRGRMGRQWSSPPGQSLTFTAALPFPGALPSLPPFTLAVGVALHRAIEAVIREGGGDASRLTLKWPNDLLVGDRKIAGVLCETTQGTTDEGEGHVVLVGVGLNVNTVSFPGELASVATSLRKVTGAEQDRELVLARVLIEMEDAASRFRREGFASFGSEYASRCRLWGRSVDVEGITGTMHGVDGTGALVLRHADGTTSVIAAGTVTLRGEGFSPR